MWIKDGESGMLMIKGVQLSSDSLMCPCMHRVRVEVLI